MAEIISAVRMAYPRVMKEAFIHVELPMNWKAVIGGKWGMTLYYTAWAATHGASKGVRLGSIC